MTPGEITLMLLIIVQFLTQLFTGGLVLAVLFLKDK